MDLRFFGFQAYLAKRPRQGWVTPQDDHQMTTFSPSWLTALIGNPSAIACVTTVYRLRHHGVGNDRRPRLQR